MLRSKAASTLAAAVVCICATGCAPAFHKPMTDQAKTRIKEVEVRAIVVQEGPIFSARAPGVAAAAGGGLIPALIDASIQNSRQKELVSKVSGMLDGIDTYDFRAEYANSLTALGQKGFPLNIVKQTVTPHAYSRSDLDKAIAATKAGKPLLLLITHYELEPNMSALSMRTSASLWADGEVEKAYGNHFIFQAPTYGTDTASNANKWGESNAKLLCEQITLGVRETLRMLAMDLAARGVTPQDSAAFKSSSARYSFNVGGLSQYVMGVGQGVEQGRVVMRDEQGALFSLPR